MFASVNSDCVCSKHLPSCSNHFGIGLYWSKPIHIIYQNKLKEAYKVKYDLNSR